MEQIFKSVLEADRAPVVVCDLSHIIIYMNKAAVQRYDSYGGGALVGKSIFECHNEKSAALIKQVVAWFLEHRDNNIIYTSRNNKENKDVYMVALRDDSGKLIAYYEKHEYRTPETASLYDFNGSLS